MKIIQKPVASGRVHRVPAGTVADASKPMAFDPRCTLSKAVAKRLAKNRRARICWNVRGAH